MWAKGGAAATWRALEAGALCRRWTREAAWGPAVTAWLCPDPLCNLQTELSHQKPLEG